MRQRKLLGWSLFCAFAVICGTPGVAVAQTSCTANLDDGLSKVVEGIVVTYWTDPRDPSVQYPVLLDQSTQCRVMFASTLANVCQLAQMKIAGKFRKESLSGAPDDYFVGMRATDIWFQCRDGRTSELHNDQP